jgi:hypothetical protein
MPGNPGGRCGASRPGPHWQWSARSMTRQFGGSVCRLHWHRHRSGRCWRADWHGRSATATAIGQTPNGRQLHPAGLAFFAEHRDLTSVLTLWRIASGAHFGDPQAGALRSGATMSHAVDGTIASSHCVPPPTTAPARQGRLSWPVAGQTALPRYGRPAGRQAKGLPAESGKRPSSQALSITEAARSSDRLLPGRPADFRGSPPYGSDRQSAHGRVKQGKG